MPLIAYFFRFASFAFVFPYVAGNYDPTAAERKQGLIFVFVFFPEGICGVARTL